MLQSKVRWSFFDIVIVYVGIVIFTFLGQYILSLFNLPSLQINEINAFFFDFLIQFAVTIGMVGIIAIFIRRGTLRDLGVNGAPFRAYIRYGLWGGIMLMFLILLLSIPMRYLEPDIQPQIFEDILRTVSGGPQFMIMLVVGGLLAPLAEEIFYRGMIYPVFRQHWGKVWGAVAAGMIFGLAHWDLWRTIPIAIGGALLCYIYEKSGSILVSALAHCVWNTSMSLIIYFSIIQGF